MIIKNAMHIKAGQKWEYRDSLESLWQDDVKNFVEILEVRSNIGIFGIPMPTAKVRFDGSDGMTVYKVGDEVDFAVSNFGTSKYFRLMDSEVGKSGVYCGKCGDYYKYALFHVNFNCWSCRNGW